MRNAIIGAALLLCACNTAEPNPETGITPSDPAPPEALGGEGIVMDANWSLPLWRDSKPAGVEGEGESSTYQSSGDEALADPKQLVEDLARARRAALQAAGKGNHAEALQCWQRALEIAPDDALMRVEMARSHAALGDARAAADACRRAWSDGAQVAAYYSSGAFASIKNEAAWIGWLAEMDALSKAGE